MLYVIGFLVSWTTVQHLTAEEWRDHGVQEQIRDYHGYLEDSLVSEDFGTSLDGYYSFVNDDDEGIAKVEPNEEVYQWPPYLPDIYEIIYNSDEERAASSYDQ